MFTVKIVLVAKPIFECQGVLTDITLERESKSPYAVTSCSEHFQMLCRNKSFWAPFLCRVSTCVRSRGSVIGISTCVPRDVPGFEARVGGKKLFASP